MSAEQKGTIVMHPVESGHIKAVGYDNGSLVVEYKTGRRFSFNGVDADQFEKIRTAESVGKAVNALKIQGVLHQEPKAAKAGEVEA